MAIFGRKATNERRPSIVASAARIKLGNKSEAERLRKIRQKATWQADLWTYYDAIGEVAYATNFLGWALSRLRLFVGRREAPGAEPVEVTNNDIATEALDRLRSPGAGHGELLRMFGLNLTVPGECYLVGTHERTNIPETWRVRSIEEVKLESGGGTPKLIGGADGLSSDLELDDDDFFLRVWIPHPNKLAEPDSPLRPLIDVCEDLLVASRASRAVMRSRLSAGLLLWPEEMTLLGVEGQVDNSGGGGEPMDPTLKALIDAMTTPIQDEGDASAVVPLIAKAKGEALQHLRHVLLERKMDPELEKKIDLARERLAQGLPVPAEIVTGMADVNHWTAWQISDDTFKAHVEPRAISVCDSLTAGYLQPYLETRGRPAQAPTQTESVESSEFVVWFDPSALVVRPNRGEDAKDAHDKLVISDKALRRELDFEESDAPGEEERRRRVEANRPPAREPSGDQPPPEPGPPEEPEDGDDGDGEQSRQGAAEIPEGERLDDLAGRLLAIDRILRERLVAGADLALQRVLERAGARIRTRAQNNREITAALRDVHRAEDRAPTLGPRLVASLGLEERELIAGGFADLRGRFERWAAQAQRQALRLVPDLTDAEREEIATQQEVDRTEAGRWLETALEELAMERLYDPRPEAPEVGEFDDTTAVPFDILREAIARAGGALGANAPGIAAAAGESVAVRVTHKVLGIATGWLLRNLFQRQGIETEGYEWEYGQYPRSHPFEPHEQLDGVQFVNFDDEVLRNFESFPAWDYYLPGDHGGCRCDAVPVMIRRRAQEAA